MQTSTKANLVWIWSPYPQSGSRRLPKLTGTSLWTSIINCHTDPIFTDMSQIVKMPYVTMLKNPNIPGRTSRCGWFPNILIKCSCCHGCKFWCQLCISQPQSMQSTVAVEMWRIILAAPPDTNVCTLWLHRCAAAIPHRGTLSSWLNTVRGWLERLLVHGPGFNSQGLPGNLGQDRVSVCFEINFSDRKRVRPVSYTHLTLPTKRIV